MTNEQLVRNMKSVGQACFVKNFSLFLDLKQTRAGVIDTLLKESGYTKKSCLSRTIHARRIIKAGLAKEALEMIVSSPSKRVSEVTREQARLFLKEY